MMTMLTHEENQKQTGRYRQMPFSYEIELRRVIDTIHPDASHQLQRIQILPEAAAKQILNELLVRACQCQNCANIQAGRFLMQAIPHDWLSAALPAAIGDTINLSDEWEYRRLLELLEILKSEQLQHYVGVGRASGNEEIRETATEYS